MMRTVARRHRSGGPTVLLQSSEGVLQQGERADCDSGD